MTLSVVNLGYDIYDTDTNPYTIASITPSASCLLLLFIHTAGAGAAVPSTIVGNGVTWTQLQTTSSSSFILSVGTLYSATTDRSFSTGTITVTFPAGQLGMEFTVEQVMSTQGLPFVQQSSIGTVSATNPTLTLSSTPSPDSVLVGMASKPSTSTPAYSAGGSFTQLSAVTSAEKIAGSEYWVSPTDGVIRFTGASHADSKIAGVEVREPSGGWGIHR